MDEEPEAESREVLKELEDQIMVETDFEGLDGLYKEYAAKSMEEEPEAKRRRSEVVVEKYGHGRSIGVSSGAEEAERDVLGGIGSDDWTSAGGHEHDGSGGSSSGSSL